MENNIIAYALFLNGSNKFEVELQFSLISRMANNLLKNEEFDADEFALLVEDIAGNQPISVNFAKKLLLQTKCFIFDGTDWKFNDELYIEKWKVAPEQLADIFNRKKTVKKENVQVDDKKAAIIQGIKWCIHMVQLAQEADMQGLPAFLRCGEEDSLIGKNVAGTATSDALSLLCNGVDYIKECNIEPKILADSFEFLINHILDCQYTERGWDTGGFFPLEDQPEAEHPTVDATCLAIMALCDFYTNRENLEKDLNIEIEIESITIEDSVLLGIDYLLRMQQPEGSYGIYRYEDEYPDGKILDNDCKTGFAIPNENCTRMALSTMGVCKGSGIFDAHECFELYGKCNDCISRAYDYIKKHATDEQGYSIWAPYFGTNVENYPVADVVISAARVCRSFIPVWWQCKEERAYIRKCYSDFLGFWRQNAKSIKGKKGKYSFKTPRKERYSVGTYNWESYPEMIAAFTVLQGYNLFGIALNKEEWDFLDNSIEYVLALQHPHGHWNSPSSTNPFCAATLAAMELLKEYRIARGLI